MARWRAAVVSVTNELHEPSGLNLKYVKFAECSHAWRFQLSSAESSHLNRAGGEAGRLRPSAHLCCITHRPDPSCPPPPNPLVQLPIMPLTLEVNLLWRMKP